MGPDDGAEVCWRHGGKAPQVVAHAAVRAEIMAWGLDAPKVEPGETLLRLLGQAAARVAKYGSLLADAYDGGDEFSERFAGSGVAALIGLKYAVTPGGDQVAVGEAIRGLVELEGIERDRCARFAKLALDAGIDERRVRLVERQAEMLERILRAALDRAGIGESDRMRVLDAVPVVLGELVGVAE